MAGVQNKTGEPAFQLKLEPDVALIFKGKLKEEPITVDLELTNTSKIRQTFKVKCTDNEIFRVRPPLGFIKPDETITIRITYSSSKQPMEGVKHYFALYHAQVDDEKTNARQAWTPTTKPEGVKRLGVIFQDTASDDKKGTDEKKDEREVGAATPKDKKGEKNEKEEKKEDKKEEKDDKPKEDKKEEKEDKKEGTPKEEKKK